MNVFKYALSVVFVLGLLACPGPKKSEISTTAVEKAAVVAQGDKDKDKQGPKKVKDCANEQGGQMTATNVKANVIKDAQGRQVTHVGADFGGAQQVSVVELLANPKKYQDKIVRVSGDVSTMCTHRRGWFAVVAQDKSGKSLRIFTIPKFLVPEGSIGKVAVAEGRVELIELAPEHAKHLAKEHQLAEPKEGAGPVVQVILRATGAEFI